MQKAVSGSVVLSTAVGTANQRGNNAKWHPLRQNCAIYVQNAEVS